jgi:hypothetical protein
VKPGDHITGRSGVEYEVLATLGRSVRVRTGKREYWLDRTTLTDPFDGLVHDGKAWRRT